ncbi:MAG: sugar phosphate isomerase/epimerase [Defluviitaleaceae bacterium]|nr:sugar phosphate isomerase/epimerase [Defluviitaleaceae bacterium]MCL2262252.1 sugar phosphate isomerase/epimerase [Defluviitaleaceae bacterium]
MKYGAQLYTIRDFMQTHKDFAGSIKKISRLGFECVQVAGVSSEIPPAEIAETCQAHGLEIVGTCPDPDEIKDNLQEVIAAHKMMNAKFVCIDRLPKKYELSKGGFLQFFLEFTTAARQIKEEGMQLLYHHHHFEFERYDGKLAIEFIRENFRDANFALDTYWMQAGGADPTHWITRLKSRASLLNLRDFAVIEGISRMCEVMEGNLNWPRIMNAAEEAGIEYAIIGQDECYGANPFDSLGKSLFNLRNKLSKNEFEDVNW